MENKQTTGDSWSKIHVRWLKHRVKSFLLDHEFWKTRNRFSSADYRSRKEYWDRYIESLVTEIGQYRINEKPDLRLPEHPVKICPDRHISNLGDQTGRVFEYQGKICRGIYKESVSGFKQVWDTGVLQVLAEHSLVPHITISDYVTDEYALVLDVERVTIQKNTVWTYAMIKDACILTVVLKQVLNRFGLTLIDGHLNNLTFHRGNPMFIDIGSIVPYFDNGVLAELVFAGVYRLVFGYIGNSMMYRLPSHDLDNGNIFIVPRRYNMLDREYTMARKALKHYYLLRGTFLQRRIVHNVFDLYKYEAQDIDLLFPISNTDPAVSASFWDAALKEAGCVADLKTAVTGGNTFGLAEAALFDQNPDILVRSMDFTESRLDQAYLALKPLRRNSQTFLYNYMYLQSEQVTAMRSDAAVYVDPLNDHPNFLPSSDKVLAGAIVRLAEKYLLIACPASEESRYQTFCQEELAPDAELIQTVRPKQSDWLLLVLQMKNRH